MASSKREKSVGQLGQRFAKAVANRELDAPQKLEAEAPKDVVEMARVIEPYGVRGWLKIQVFSLPATTLLKTKQCLIARIPRLINAHQKSEPSTQVEEKPSKQSLALGTEWHQVRVLQAKMHGQYLLMQWAGVNDRDQALSWKGFTVFMEREQFAPTEDDEFYWVDLEECYVYNTENQLLGQVQEVMDNGAHALLSVRCCTLGSTPDDVQWCLDKKGRIVTSLVPFVKEYVPEVDVQAKRLVTTWSFD